MHVRIDQQIRHSSKTEDKLQSEGRRLTGRSRMSLSSSSRSHIGAPVSCWWPDCLFLRFPDRFQEGVLICFFPNPPAECVWIVVVWISCFWIVVVCRAWTAVCLDCSHKGLQVKVHEHTRHFKRTMCNLQKATLQSDVAVSKSHRGEKDAVCTACVYETRCRCIRADVEFGCPFLWISWKGPG